MTPATHLTIEVTSKPPVRDRAYLARSPPPICYQRLQLSRFCCVEIASAEEISLKRNHIVPVFFIALGCCYAQPPADVFRSAYSFSNGVTEPTSASEPTISVARLRHKIPGKAAAAFSRALKFARRREWRQGAKELEAAV